MNFLGSFLSTLKPRFDDDVVDRLNYYYTTIIILVLAITISAKQYVGQPIQCWVPAQFTGAWEQYAENYCFVQNTYWVPLQEVLPESYETRQSQQIGYYQWVPFVLAIEAMLFYVPCIVWRLLNWQSGISVDNVVTMAADSKNIQSDQRDKAVLTIAKHIEDAIDLQRDFGAHAQANLSSFVTHCGKTHGSYVTLLYLVVKLLYVGNVIGQFFLLNAFLNPRYFLWGAEILADLARGVEWEESGHFPRVTMCDFEVRVLGNLHRYTIQCVLMINMFNEKIFLFLWWWYLLVAGATLLNLAYWIGISIAESRQVGFVVRFLRVSEDVVPSERRSAERFVLHALRRDGVFVLRMIASHAGDLIATEIMAALWRSFKSKLERVHKPRLVEEVYRRHHARPPSDYSDDPLGPLISFKHPKMGASSVRSRTPSYGPTEEPPPQPLQPPPPPPPPAPAYNTSV